MMRPAIREEKIAPQAVEPRPTSRAGIPLGSPGHPKTSKRSSVADLRRTSKTASESGSRRVVVGGWLDCISRGTKQRGPAPTTTGADKQSRRITKIPHAAWVTLERRDWSRESSVNGQLRPCLFCGADENGQKWIPSDNRTSQPRRRIL
jgi:hypothetical protein